MTSTRIVFSDLSGIQSKAKMEIKTLNFQLDSLIHNFRKEKSHRTSQRIRIRWDYRISKLDANHHRRRVGLKDPAIIDLDSATNTDILHIELMMGSENQAREACYMAVNLIRSS